MQQVVLIAATALLMPDPRTVAQILSEYRQPALPPVVASGNGGG